MSQEQTRQKKKSTIIWEGYDKPNASKARHYVDNAEFYNALVERQRQIEEAKQRGDDPPRVSEYIGECFLKIASNMIKHKSFSSPKFNPIRDDMVFDAIQAELRAVDKFDPNNTKNPFSYFSQVCFYAFLNRIKIEDKHRYIRYKSMKEAPVIGESATDGEHTMDNVEVGNEMIDEFIENYEQKMNLNKDKVKKSQAEGILQFIDGGE